MKFYLASKVTNGPYADQVIKKLEGRGWENTFNWATAPNLRDLIPPHGYLPAAYREQAAVTATKEMEGVRAADVLIALLPGGRGTHIEIGAALVHNKPVILCLEETEEPYMDGKYPCAFYSHPRVTMMIGPWADEFLDNLQEHVLNRHTHKVIEG